MTCLCRRAPHLPSGRPRESVSPCMEAPPLDGSVGRSHTRSTHPHRPRGFPAMPTLTAESLHSFARSLFEAGGVAADEAEVVARNLVDANLCGHDSHGAIRVVQYLGA